MTNGRKQGITLYTIARSAGLTIVANAAIATAGP